MTDYSHYRFTRLVPYCMRLTEQPLPLPEGGLRVLFNLLSDDAAEGQLLTDSQLKMLAIQTWRLGRRIERLCVEGTDRTQRQFKDSYNRLSDVLKDLGVTIEDPINCGFTDGWIEVDVIAWEDPDGPAPDGVTGPWVKQTIKPVVRISGRLLSRGEIVVADPVTK